MIFKNLLNLGLIIFLSLLSLSSFAESSVWKISKGGKYFYLGGTVHLLNADDHPLPQEFMEAYEDADKLIFETDIEASKTQETQQKFLAVMISSSANILQSELNAENYAKLKEFLALRQIFVEDFSNFFPWAVSLIVSVMEYERLGMVAEYGVDEYFSQLSLSEQKEVGSLESLDEQISYIKSMENIDPNLMISYTISDLNELPSFIKEVKEGWRKGDMDTFTNNSSIVQMKSEFPELYNTLITKRNNSWMTDLLKLNSNEINEFVLVGTMHLNGEEGLLNQLKLAGFDIEQL